MKILFFTDTHIRATSPGSRLDDFPSAIMSKLRWIGEYANENEIDLIVHGGDWLDRPDIPNSNLRQLAMIINSWNKPVYTVVGNHDLYGYNPKTFPRTALGLLEGVGIIKRLSLEPTVFGNVSLTGVDAHFGLDKNDNVSDYVDVPGDPNHIKIHVVHGFLDKAKWPDVPSTAIKDILETTADYILTGHEHTGYGIIRHDKKKKVFCNPGALARVTASVGDVNQEVKVAVINTEIEGHIELVKLPSSVVRNANEVLDRERLLIEKEHKKQLEVFTRNMTNVSMADHMDYFKALSELANEEEVDKSIIEMARLKLELAEEQIGKEE